MNEFQPLNGTEASLRECEKEKEYWKNAAENKWSTAANFMFFGFLLGSLMGFAWGIQA